MSERKSKTVVVCSQEQYDPGQFSFDGSLNAVIESLQVIRNSIQAEFRDTAVCEIDSHASYEDTHYAHILVTYSRPETDEEMTEREERYMRKLNEAKRRAKRRELAMLATLKAKYGA